jgi:Family of unknown function (DUF6401)
MSNAEMPARLSAVALRLAGQVGQGALDWVAAGDAARRADLDQHMAAVRDALADCAAAPGGPAAAVTARAAADARVRAADCSSLGDLLFAMVRSCPDGPFGSGSRCREPGPPLPLLLRYVCGFVEEAVSRDWWPPAEPEAAPDWEAMRLAAACQLISQAEQAAELRWRPASGLIVRRQRRPDYAPPHSWSASRQSGPKPYDLGPHGPIGSCAPAGCAPADAWWPPTAEAVESVSHLAFAFVQARRPRGRTAESLLAFLTSTASTCPMSSLRRVLTQSD